jgi:RNA polymerase sigma factor (sigma-70 family)
MNSTKDFDQYSDGDIISKILSGEKALFEILIRRNNPILYKTGRSYGYNHEDTQDLMQESFINAYTNLRKFENRSSFKTWITRIMINNCFQKSKKSSYKNEVTSEVIDEKSIPMYSNHIHTDTAKVLLNREFNHLLENSLEQIPLDYRMVFSLRELNGLNVSETAEALSISESNVKVRLNRAKSMLRKEIEKSYSPAEIYDFNLLYCDAIVNRVMHEIMTCVIISNSL